MTKVALIFLLLLFNLKVGPWRFKRNTNGQYWTNSSTHFEVFSLCISRPAVGSSFPCLYPSRMSQKLEASLVRLQFRHGNSVSPIAHLNLNLFHFNSMASVSWAVGKSSVALAVVWKISPTIPTLNVLLKELAITIRKRWCTGCWLSIKYQSAKIVTSPLWSVKMLPTKCHVVAFVSWIQSLSVEVKWGHNLFVLKDCRICIHKFIKYSNCSNCKQVVLRNENTLRWRRTLFLTIGHSILIHLLFPTSLNVTNK